MNDQTQIAKKYCVRLINYYEEFDEPQVTEFTSHDPEHVKTMISAYCAFYSGDPYKCWINGEETVLHLDWGLSKNTLTKKQR